MFDVAAWSNEPILPGVSVADAGKVIAVDANGELTAASIASAKKYMHYVKLFVSTVRGYTFQFVSEDNTPLTNAADVKTWLKNNGFNSEANAMPLSPTGIGLYLAGTTTKLETALGMWGSTQLLHKLITYTFSIDESNNIIVNYTTANNTFSPTSVIDTVMEI